MTKQFRLWAMCCSHVGTDLSFGRESLADAIRQSEHGGEEGGPPFEWDIAVVLGDHSGGQTTPTDDEGERDCAAVWGERKASAGGLLHRDRQPRRADREGRAVAVVGEEVDRPDRRAVRSSRTCMPAGCRTPSRAPGSDIRSKSGTSGS